MSTDRMKTISTSELRKTLQETIDRVHYTGESIIVSRHGKPWAMITKLNEDDKDLQAFVQAHTDPSTGKIRKKAKSK